jgi:hypothetical protein
MWIAHTTGADPVIIGNSPDTDIAGYLRRDYPDATLYRCHVPNAHNIAAQHRDQAEVVYTEQPGEPDADGNPTTQMVGDWELIGNSLAIDTEAPALVMLDPDGAEVGRLPLDFVP